MFNVEIVEMDSPVFAVCQKFTGPYSDTPFYIEKTKNILREKGAAILPDIDFIVYLDPPGQKKPEELEFLCGAITESYYETAGDLIGYRIYGNYLLAKASGYPEAVMLPLYQSLLNYIIDEQIVTESGSRIQIIKQINDSPAVEVYIKIKDKTFNVK